MGWTNMIWIAVLAGLFGMIVGAVVVWALVARFIKNVWKNL